MIYSEVILGLDELYKDSIKFGLSLVYAKDSCKGRTLFRVRLGLVYKQAKDYHFFIKYTIQYLQGKCIIVDGIYTTGGFYKFTSRPPEVLFI